MRKTIRLLAIISLILLFIVLSCNRYIINFAEGKLYDATENIPKNKVGLLLGTSKYTINGNLNGYYKNRVEATVELFYANKIDFVLISGDNGRRGYDEPTLFKEDLIAKGIPKERIFLDYAGFRTLDSVIRAKEIFGQTSITVISQKFHNERAIFLAGNHGITAIGFNAKDVSSYNGFKTNLRECLAKTKAVIDILLNVSPKYLGEQIEIK